MHAFVQQLGDKQVIDRAWRIEQPEAVTGYVLEAPYFGGGVQPQSEGWWNAVLRFVTWAKELPRGLQFNLPFDEQGNDVLELCAAEIAGVTVARGQIVGLRRGSGVVLRDLWLDDVRYVELEDFAVAGDDGMVLVACGMAPLVIATPTPCQIGDWLAPSSERMRDLAPRSTDQDRSGASLQLAVNDTVEIRGIARALSTTARTINLSDWRGDYRTAPPIPDRLIGDEEGTRLVIRKLG